MRRIPYADYRVNEVIAVFNSKDFTNSSHEAPQANRLFRKRYGIKIEFHQNGKLGEFKNHYSLVKIMNNTNCLTPATCEKELLTAT